MKTGSTVLIALILVLGASAYAYAAGYAFIPLNYPGASQTLTPVDGGNPGTEAGGINNAGTVAGSYTDTSAVSHGFSLSNGTYTPVTYSGPDVSGTWVDGGINDAGDIVGEYQTTSGACNGFLLSSGTYTPLTYPTATGCTCAVGINNAGAIVGRYKESGVEYGFLLENGTTYSSLMYPGAKDTRAARINTAGTIVGRYIDASGVTHGFLLKNGTTYTSVNYPGASSTEAQLAIGINDNDTIVGSYADASGVSHGFVLSDGIYTSLTYPGASGTYAMGINNAGTIAGTFTDASGFHGFLAIPLAALSTGWNLISLPVQPANAAIASVLSGIKGALDVVWAYPNQTWKVYDPNDTAGSTLTTMQAGTGYWIKMTSAKTLSVSGSALSPSVQLSAGWNLVGYNGTSCTGASAALSPTSFGSLQAFNSSPGVIPVRSGSPTTRQAHPPSPTFARARATGSTSTRRRRGPFRRTKAVGQAAPKRPSPLLRVVHHALEIDHHDRLVTDHPRIVTAPQHGDLSRLDVPLCSVVCLDMASL